MLIPPFLLQLSTSLDLGTKPCTKLLSIGSGGSSSLWSSSCLYTWKFGRLLGSRCTRDWGGGRSITLNILTFRAECRAFFPLSTVLKRARTRFLTF